MTKGQPDIRDIQRQFEEFLFDHAAPIIVLCPEVIPKLQRFLTFAACKAYREGSREVLERVRQPSRS